MIIKSNQALGLVKLTCLMTWGRRFHLTKVGLSVLHGLVVFFERYAYSKLPWLQRDLVYKHWKLSCKSNFSDNSKRLLTPCCYRENTLWLSVCTPPPSPPPPPPPPPPSCTSTLVLTSFSKSFFTCRFTQGKKICKLFPFRESPFSEGETFRKGYLHWNRSLSL